MSSEQADLLIQLVGLLLAMKLIDYVVEISKWFYNWFNRIFPDGIERS